MFRTGFGCEGSEERQIELVAMLNDAMASMCMLLELAAQSIEDAEVERKCLEESVEMDTAKAERGSGSSVGDRPMSWLVPVNANNRGFATPVSPSMKSCMLLSIPTYDQRNPNPTLLLSSIYGRPP